jgi:hypothetical protein
LKTVIYFTSCYYLAIVIDIINTLLLNSIPDKLEFGSKTITITFEFYLIFINDYNLMDKVFFNSVLEYTISIARRNDNNYQNNYIINEQNWDFQDNSSLAANDIAILDDTEDSNSEEMENLGPDENEPSGFGFIDSNDFLEDNNLSFCEV